MASFNKVILVGNMTADPELKQTPNGIPVTTFTVAVNRRAAKAEQRTADFINCVAWRQQAELISRYFHKGSCICIVGNLQVRDWTDKANKETNEYYKFFSYYVPLNFLYNHEFEGINQEKEQLVLFVSKTLSDPQFKNFSINTSKRMKNMLQ